MNRLPSNLVGREVSLILNSGDELEGKCTMAREDYLILRVGPCEWTVDRAMLDTKQGKEKTFEIGQRVRIIGPTARGNKASIGKCFVVEEINVPTWRYYGYSRHDCPHIFPASSLELAEPEPDSTDQRFQAIETQLQALKGELANARHTFQMGDYRCLKAILGLIQAATGPETSSDELDCLNRLIEAARQFENIDVI